MKEYIQKALARHDLTEEEASRALEFIVSGDASGAQIAALLIALAAKGESVSELVGFARTMRAHAVAIRVDDPDAVDIVGTGGDGLGTFNVSTVTAFVVAGAGVTVAKHGNRSASGTCGSADVLHALGVNLDLTPERVEECVNRTGIGFLFAPVFHPAMRHAAHTRRDIGVRTIFNMIGPLTNPAGVRRQVIGAFTLGAAGALAEAAGRLGAHRTCVVHNAAGMDEVGLQESTAVFQVETGRSTARYELSAADFRLPPHPVAHILSRSVDDNVTTARKVLDGERGAPRDVVVANAALALYVAGRAHGMDEAARCAEESIDSGRARGKLRMLAEAAAA